MLLWTDDSIDSIPAATTGRARLSSAAWRASAVCPATWARSLAECDGTFFHSPVGLRLATPLGEARFLEYGSADQPEAIAAITLRRCRLSPRFRHAHLATLPAVAPGADRRAAMAGLRQWLRDAGIADVVVDSFAANDNSDVDASWLEPVARVEFSVPLDTGPEGIVARCNEQHRRRIRAGERAGWAMRTLRGVEAREAIAHVQGLASDRAEQRGDGFEAAAAPADPIGCSALSDAWGVTTLGAYDGDTLLSAAVVGWGNGSAYYLIGGSTEAGYSRSAAPWLHWRAMLRFADAGATSYNLGGVPAAASSPDHAAHGLHRFKSAFGGEQRQLVSARWTFGTGHARSHAAARWVAERVSA
jgi:hypothetical protein